MAYGAATSIKKQRPSAYEADDSALLVL